MLTLTLPIAGWIIIPLIIFISGKSLQQGGRTFERGGQWELETLLGTCLQIFLIVSVGILIMHQNFTAGSSQ